MYFNRVNQTGVIKLPLCTAICVYVNWKETSKAMFVNNVPIVASRQHLVCRYNVMDDICERLKNFHCNKITCHFQRSITQTTTV